MFWDRGHRVVVGMDEVGRGAWAGPLTVAAVVANPDRRVNGVRDSKMLTESEREVIADRITGWASAWSIGHASNEECDALGMSEAHRLAARRTIERLGMVPDHLLLDGVWDFVGSYPATTLKRGDLTCLSIAAASVLAKVERDKIMRDADSHFPFYGFARNKGYPSPDHIAALEERGATSFHRRSWSFMDRLPPIGALPIDRTRADVDYFDQLTSQRSRLDMDGS
jgi:ribonuclease HII